MSRKHFTGPRLPRDLLDKVDTRPSASKHFDRDHDRKDRRKAERQDKKASRTRTQTHRYDTTSADTLGRDERRNNQPVLSSPRTRIIQQPPKSILKKVTKPVQDTSSESEDDAPDDEECRPQRKDKLLSREDAEIAALEKKLGITSKKRKAFEDDGLDWLVDGSDTASDSSSSGRKRKRTEDDDWLDAKRRQAESTRRQSSQEESSQSDEEHDLDLSSGEGEHISLGSDGFDSDMEDLENPFSEDELSSGDDQSEDEAPRKPPKARENPYVAPVSKASAAKYVPPSMRKTVTTSTEDLSQLKRQIQGQLNRLSENNFLTIVQAIEQILQNTARQHVFSVLIDLLHGLIASPSILNETFLILHAGFAAAIYKVVGVDFGAALLERIVSSINDLTAQSAPGKQVLNLVGFVTNLYVLQMVGSVLIFDYIRQFLHSVSEDNTELLLRIIRISGQQLRQDDPTSLKDIVILLTRLVADTGEQNISVRTKFMIETITDLKNNRLKTGASATALASEHVTSTKKLLGALNTRSLRASEPLQISIADIQDSEKKGKWWLVGASYHDPAKMAQRSKAAPGKSIAIPEDGYESETPGHISLQKLARAQGMNTDVRRAIFMAMMSASDYKDAHLRIMKLHLKNKQVVEVPKVLLQCAAAEKIYNPYYTLIASKLCGSDKKILKAFHSALWTSCTKLTNGIDEETSEANSTRSIVNTARLFGALLSDQQLQLTSLKPLDFAYPAPSIQTFAEVLLTSMFLHLHKTSRTAFEQKTESIFTHAAKAPRMAAALQLFLSNTVARAEITNGPREKKIVEQGCAVAVNTLKQSVTGIEIQEESSDELSDEEF